MNNEQVNGDQLIQLQNFAYLKQFMSRMSVKVLMVVGFLQAAMIAVFYFFIGESVKDFIYNLVGIVGGSSADSPDNLVGFLSATLMISAIIATAFGLVLPITLLVITLRAGSDDPTVVPRGAVRFLHVLSVIQFVFSILGVIGSVISVIFMVASLQGESDYVLSSGIEVNSVSNIISSLISGAVSCMYYYTQMKFLGAIKLSCNGYSLMSIGAQGFGVFSIIYAIINGMAFVFMAILSIVISAFSSATMLGGDSDLQEFVELGLMDFLLPILVFATVALLLNMVYQIAMATIAFGYKNTVTEAVRASYAVASNNPYNRANATANSPYKTYGGSNIYSSYNYTNSGSSGQQTQQHSASSHTAPVVTEENVIRHNSRGGSFTPEHNDYKNYGGDSVNSNNNYGGGSFTPDNDYNNYGGGSFTPDNDYNNHSGGSFAPEDNYNNYDGGSFTPDSDYSNNPFLQDNGYYTSGSENNQPYDSNDNTPSNSSFFQ